MSNARRAREAGPVKSHETGRWDFVVDLGVGSNGKRKQARRRGFKSRAQAQEALNALRSSVAERAYVPPAYQSVSEYLDEWLAVIAGDLQPSTLSSYTRVLRVHVRPRIGGVQLRLLDAGSLNALYADLRETLSPRTIRYVHAIVHNALKEAVRSGRVVRNVADAARPPRAKESRAREMTIWSASDVVRFFDLEDVKGNRDRVAWWVAVMTGLRRGELLGLRWRDVDLDASQVAVAQTITAVDHKIVITPGTKTGKGRSFEIDAGTIAQLRTHRARQAQEQLSLGIRPGDTSLLFARPDGTPLDPDRFSERFIRLVERHTELMPRITFHGLRHTHATLLLRAGVPITVVSRRLGHSSIAITGDIYQHVDSEMQADAAARAAALIFDAGVRDRVVTSKPCNVGSEIV